jgi:hypothetical protein
VRHELTRKQAEGQAELDNAVGWGMFEGDGPTPKPRREAGKFDPARPGDVDRNLRELGERIAAPLDEQTRNDLHDFIVAPACNTNMEQTGLWLFAPLRAMKPLEEPEDDRPQPPDPNHHPKGDRRCLTPQAAARAAVRCTGRAVRATATPGNATAAG